MCLFVYSFLPPRASIHRKYRYVYTCSQRHGKLFYNIIIVIFAENASFRSYVVICLPRIPLTTTEPCNIMTFDLLCGEQNIVRMRITVHVHTRLKKRSREIQKSVAHAGPIFWADKKTIYIRTLCTELIYPAFSIDWPTIG